MALFPIAHAERRDSGVATEDATVTTIQTINVKQERAVTIKAFIIASRNTTSSGGTAGDTATYDIEGSFRDSAGTLAQVGDTIKVANEVDSSWDVGFSVSGNNINITVTGEASVDIDWRCYSMIYKD